MSHGKIGRTSKEQTLKLLNPPIKEVRKPWGKEIWFAQAPK